MTAGRRNRLIIFERATVTTDDYGGETPTWAEYTRAWAEYETGSSREKREAAQEESSQTGTFIALWTPTLAAITAADRINFNGDLWDLDGPGEPLGLNKRLRFTAVRSS